MEARKIKKLYYSISEVSEFTDLKQYVLRYWETEFTQLRPKKNAAGNRVYRSSDIDIILKIKNLLYDRKFTIKGAQQHLKAPVSSKLMKNNKKIVKIIKSDDLSTLNNIKQGLDDLYKIVDQFKD